MTKDIIINVDNPDNYMEKMLKATDGFGSGSGVFDIGGKEFKMIKFKDLKNNTFKPKTLEEFLEIINKLERQGILSEGYDGYYSEGCTIFVDGNGYYVR